jgi:hypothetical protein
MRCPKDNLLERLVRHRPYGGLDTEGVEHVAHARADDPLDFFGLGAHARTR